MGRKKIEIRPLKVGFILFLVLVLIYLFFVLLG